MRLAVPPLQRHVGRTVVARRAANRHAQLRRVLDRLVQPLRELLIHLSVRVLRPSPTDRNHARLVNRVVDRLIHRVNEAIRRVRRKVNRDGRPGRDGSGHLDVQRYFAVRIGVRARHVRPAIHAHRHHSGHGDAQAFEVSSPDRRPDIRRRSASRNLSTSFSSISAIDWPLAG